jgi:hypothetical protein
MYFIRREKFSTVDQRGRRRGCQSQYGYIAIEDNAPMGFTGEDLAGIKVLGVIMGYIFNKKIIKIAGSPRYFD